MNVVEGERLTLKKLVEADKKRLIELIGDFRVSETLSNVPIHIQMRMLSIG